MAVTTTRRPTRVASPNWFYYVRSGLAHYTTRKILKAVITIFFVTSLTFFIVRLMPGNPIDIYIQELQTTNSMSYTEARDQAASLFAIDFDKPLHLQYL